MDISQLVSETHCQCMRVKHTVSVCEWNTLSVYVNKTHCQCMRVKHTVSVCKWNTQSVYAILRIPILVMHLRCKYGQSLSQSQKLRYISTYIYYYNIYKSKYSVPETVILVIHFTAPQTFMKCVFSIILMWHHCLQKDTWALTSRILKDIKSVYFKNQGGWLIKKDDNSIWKSKTESKLNRE